MQKGVLALFFEEQSKQHNPPKITLMCLTLSELEGKFARTGAKKVDTGVETLHGWNLMLYEACSDAVLWVHQLSLIHI